MAQIHVHADFDCSADKLWGLLGDFGNLSWGPGAAALKIETEGEGPGMARLIKVGDGPVTREELYEREGALRHALLTAAEKGGEDLASLAVPVLAVASPPQLAAIPCINMIPHNTSRFMDRSQNKFGTRRRC